MNLFFAAVFITSIFGNAAADCVATKQACQDFCCEGSTGAGPNQNICDETQIVCKCFIPATKSFNTHKAAFQQACNQAGLTIGLNQGFGTTRCAACGAGRPNCQNNEPAPPKTCQELLAGGGDPATAPQQPVTVVTQPSVGCAVRGDCEYIMTAEDTLASVAVAKQITTANLECLNPGFQEGSSSDTSGPMCPATAPYAYRPLDNYDHCCPTNTFASANGNQACDGGNFVECKDQNGATTAGCVDYAAAATGDNGGKKLNIPCPSDPGEDSVNFNCGTGSQCPTNSVCTEGECVRKRCSRTGQSCDDADDDAGGPAVVTDTGVSTYANPSLLLQTAAALTAAQVLLSF